MVRETLKAVLAILVIVALPVLSVFADPQVVTVQGRLTDAGGTPLNGSFDLTFRIYELPSPPGSPLWIEAHSGVVVTNGLFSVNLGNTTPLELSIFESSPRYVGITVGTDPEIMPRTRLGASPYALRAESMPGFTPGPGNEVLGEFSFAAGDSNRVMDDYSSITGGEHNSIEIQNFADTIADTNLAPDKLMEYDPGQGRAAHAIFSAFIGGGLLNHAHGLFSCTLGGFRDSAAAAFSTIGCGFFNVTNAPASYAVIGGGFQNKTWGSYSSIGGGQLNQASGIGLTYVGETIGGGVLNRTLDHIATVGGGLRNFADGFASTIAGGYGNLALGNYSTVGGGQFINASGTHSTVGGGQNNTSTATYASVVGGFTNASSGTLAFLGGGANNLAAGDTSVIGGGSFNAAVGISSTIAGGGKNGAFGTLSTVGGGTSNSAAADLTVVGGGNSNTAIGIGSGVLGGNGNTASGTGSAVGGGSSNTAGPGAFTVVPGGMNNIASGDNSFAAGTFARAVDTCAFVWADCCRDATGVVNPLYSTGFNSWTTRAIGGYYLLTGCDSLYDPTIPGTSGVYVPAGGSTWLSGSHSSLKENIVPVDGEELLDKIDGLEIKRWNYKAQDASVEHIGPMAEDFYAAFQVGDNPFTMSAVDPAGIALAAIKELNRKTKELEKQSQRIDELEAKIQQLIKVVESNKK